MAKKKAAARKKVGTITGAVQYEGKIYIAGQEDELREAASAKNAPAIDYERLKERGAIDAEWEDDGPLEGEEGGKTEFTPATKTDEEKLNDGTQVDEDGNPV